MDGLSFYADEASLRDAVGWYWYIRPLLPFLAGVHVLVGEVCAAIRDHNT